MPIVRSGADPAEVEAPVEEMTEAKPKPKGRAKADADPGQRPDGGRSIEAPTAAEQRAEIDREFSRAMATDSPGETSAPPRLDDQPAAAAKRPHGEAP